MFNCISVFERTLNWVLVWCSKKCTKTNAFRDYHTRCPHLVFSTKTLSPRCINQSINGITVFSPLNGTATEWIPIRNAWNVCNTVLCCFVVSKTQIFMYYCVFSYLRVARFVLIKPKQSLQCHFEEYKNHCTFNRGQVQNFDRECKETLLRIVRPL